MYYKIPIEPLINVAEIYRVTRTSTWRTAEKHNIIAFVEKGCCYFDILGQKTLINEAEAVFIPANTPYKRSAYKNTACTIFYVHFDTCEQPESVSEEELREYAFKIQENILPDTFSDINLSPRQNQVLFLSDILNFSKRYEETLSHLDSIRNSDFKATNPYRKTTSALSFTKLLIEFSREIIQNINTHNSQIKKAYPVPLQKALFYTMKNYRQKITTQKLADIAGVSPQHIIRLFREHLGMTPLEYVNQTKVLHAIDMLRNPEMSIKEIAYELGFENPNYFSRLFKQKEKMTPQETRRRIFNYDSLQINSPIE